MKLTLHRKPSNDKCTIGAISIGDLFICHTLEDVVRDFKIYGETAVPAGTYDILITPSVRFKRDLPLLINVPNYAGVRIHPGNTADDTHGCILPGTTVSPDGRTIGQSKVAFDKLNKLIETALDNHEQVSITIING